MLTGLIPGIAGFGSGVLYREHGAINLPAADAKQSRGPAYGASPFPPIPSGWLFLLRFFFFCFSKPIAIPAQIWWLQNEASHSNISLKHLQAPVKFGFCSYARIPAGEFRNRVCGITLIRSVLVDYLGTIFAFMTLALFLCIVRNRALKPFINRTRNDGDQTLHLRTVAVEKTVFERGILWTISPARFSWWCVALIWAISFYWLGFEKIIRKQKETLPSL